MPEVAILFCKDSADTELCVEQYYGYVLFVSWPTNEVIVQCEKDDFTLAPVREVTEK